MKKKYLSESKIYFIICPILINDSIIEFLKGGSKFGWARVGPIQHKILNGFFMIFLIGGFIYYIYYYRNYIKNVNIFKVIIFFLLWGVSFFIHAQFVKINWLIILTYFSLGLFEFLILRDLDIE